MTIYNPDLEQYVRSVFAPQDAALKTTLEETPKKGLPAISVRPEEGRFLQFLVGAIGAQKAVEIGTLGGYSGIWIARGLRPGGRLITLEKEPFHAKVAHQHFEAAGVLSQVEIRIGDAHQRLQELQAEGPFDFVFIDAEKTGYPAYLDWAVENLRLGGTVAVHNAFRQGAILQQQGQDENTVVMQQFNPSFANHPRLLASIYPGGDGILLGLKIA